MPIPAGPIAGTLLRLLTHLGRLMMHLVWLMMHLVWRAMPLRRVLRLPRLPSFMIAPRVLIILRVLIVPRVLIAPVMLAMRVLPGLAMLPCTPAQAGLLAALQSDVMPVVIRLTVNRQPAGDAVVALRDGKGHWWLPAAALARARVSLDGSQQQRLDDIDYVALRSLAPESLDFDESQQTLALALPPTRFSASTLQAGIASQPPPSGKPAGAFLNYDLFIDHSEIGSGRSVFTEAGMALGPGVALASFALLRQPTIDANLRLDTSYAVDQPSQMTTLRLGDTISRPPTALGRPVRFAGLQFGTNFLTRPGMVTVPVPTLAGQAALPSTVDLYVNNVLQSRSAVAPGPFSLTSAPLMAGDGELLLKVTDVSGREQVISQRYYASTTLLAPGLSDFSVEAGALRLNYGLRSDDYGDFFAAGSWRRGLSQQLTVEGGASVQQGSRFGLLAGVSAAVPDLGAGSLSVGASHDKLGSGLQAAASVERRTRDHSVALRTQIADADYRQTGIPNQLQLRRLDTAFYGYRLAGLGSLSASWTRQQRVGQDALRITQLGFSTRPARWGSLVLTLIDVRGAAQDRSLNLFWILPLDGGRNASVLHSRSEQGQDQTVFQFQQTPAPGEGVGYRLQAGINAPQQAAVTAQNLHGLLRAEVAEFRGTSAVRAGLSGALVLMDGSLFAVRRVDSSFGLVRLPGLSGVRVYVDNQLAGRTDARGVALLPRLAPYMKNHVAVEPLDLPLDVQIDALKAEPVPAWRSGINVDFPLRAVSAATLNLVLANGQPVPAGAEARLAGSEADDSLPVGHQGLVYVTGMKEWNRLLVSWPGGQCLVEIPYAPEKGSIPYLGQFLCRESAGEAP